jgi:sensor histidine kinase regulating citrate/malate metabolism
MTPVRLRFGLLPKMIVFLAAVLIPLAAITWYVSVQRLRHEMTEEFTSKGTAIANSLASSGVDLILTRDASTVQALIDQFVAISGVHYVMVYDPQKHLIAHTFHPVVPPDLIDKNLVPGDAAKQVRDLVYQHPVTGVAQEIIDVGVPMLGGQLGTVRVGMNKAIIHATATRPAGTSSRCSAAWPSWPSSPAPCSRGGSRVRSALSSVSPSTSVGAT